VSRCNVETGMTKGTLRTRRLRQSTTRLNVSQTFDYYVFQKGNQKKWESIKDPLSSTEIKSSSQFN